MHVTVDAPRVPCGSNSTAVLLNLFLNASTLPPFLIPYRTTPAFSPHSDASKCSQQVQPYCHCLNHPHPVAPARHRPLLHRTPLWSYLSTTTSTQMATLSGYRRGRLTLPAKSTLHRHCLRYTVAPQNHPHQRVYQQVRIKDVSPFRARILRRLWRPRNHHRSRRPQLLSGRFKE